MEEPEKLNPEHIGDDAVQHDEPKSKPKIVIQFELENTSCERILDVPDDESPEDFPEKCEQSVGMPDLNDECLLDDHAESIVPHDYDALRPDTHRRKKRRRIVTVSDVFEESTDSEEDSIGMALPPSPTPAAVDHLAAVMSSNDEPSLDDITPETIEAMARNDKPGPKSKKASTRMLKELQTRALLQSAIVIPAAIDTKKRKIRILDSDEEDDATHVDDIGLTADEHNDLLGGENNSNSNGADAELGASAASIECEISVDEMCLALDINVGPEAKQGAADQVGENSNDGSKSDRSAIDANKSGEHRDSGNSSDGCDRHDTSNEIPARISSPYNRDSSEEEYLPNDVYFGTPDPKDMSKPTTRGRGRGRARGRPPSHGTMMRRQAEEQTPSQPRPRGRPRGSGRRGRPPTRPRFVDDRSFSSGSSSSSKSDSSSDEEREHRKSAPLSPKATSSTGCMNSRTPTTKLDFNSRFSDKSSKIPDSIYFGDVDVPLHVLHSYGNTSDDSEPEIPFFATPKHQHHRSRGGMSQSRGRGRGRPPGSTQVSRTPPTQNMPSKRGRKPGTPSSSERFLKHMKKCYKAAGLKRSRFKKIYEGCTSSQSRAEKILDLLYEHGLVGEPTISACRQLKKVIVTNEEISELDPNLIIQSEGRTRRQSARAATHRNYTFEDPEPTVAKFTPIIDSESESE